MPRSAGFKGVYVSELSKRDQAEARRLAELLQPSQEGDSSSELLFTVAGKEVAMSPQLRALVAGALGVAAHGTKATITSDKAELRTQEAADILNVSRQYLVRLCDMGRIPYRWQGKQRRLTASDVLAYKAKQERGGRDRFRDLVATSAETGAYDLDIPWPPED